MEPNDDHPEEKLWAYQRAIEDEGRLMLEQTIPENYDDALELIGELRAEVERLKGKIDEDAAALLEPATPVAEYCECGPRTVQAYLDTVSQPKKLPCPLCGRLFDPVWTWHPGDPLPNALPKGCEVLLGLSKDAKWKNEKELWTWETNFKRRWLIAGNETVFDAGALIAAAIDRDDIHTQQEDGE